MNEADQIKNIVAACKSGAAKVGVFIDDYKEERFLKALRAELPEADYHIKVEGPLIKRQLQKTLIITRKVPPISSN